MALMNTSLPKTVGSYALLLFLPRRTTLTVGRLGSMAFKRGYYLYLGSAFGPGGIRARVRRHLKNEKKHYWHIDYLRYRAEVKAVWVMCGNGNMEHHWAGELINHAIACDPIPQFGCSDCTCPSHLFYFKKNPDPQILAQGKSLAQFKISPVQRNERQRDGHRSH